MKNIVPEITIGHQLCAILQVKLHAEQYFTCIYIHTLDIPQIQALFSGKRMKAAQPDDLVIYVYQRDKSHGKYDNQQGCRYKNR